MTRSEKNKRQKQYRWEQKVEAWVRHPHCAYCGRKLQLKHCTWDHVIPRAKGGTRNGGNIVIACISCNRLKGAMEITEFIREVEAGRIVIRRELPLEIVPQRRSKEAAQ